MQRNGYLCSVLIKHYDMIAQLENIMKRARAARTLKDSAATATGTTKEYFYIAAADTLRTALEQLKELVNDTESDIDHFDLMAVSAKLERQAAKREANTNTEKK